MPTNPPPHNEKVTIILHSGAYDRASYALSMAQVALTFGLEAHMLLTYDGLRRFTRGHLKDIGEETSPAVRASIKRGLESGGIQSIEVQLADTKALGLKLYACPAAMANLNIAQEELIDEIDSIVGLGTFLGYARGASANWYI